MRAVAALAVAAAALVGCGRGSGGDAVPRSVVDAFDVGHWHASVVIEPGHVGTNQLHLTFAANGTLAADVASATVSVARRGSSARTPVALTDFGSGHYATQTKVLRAAGAWVAFIGVTGKDGAPYDHEIAFRIGT